MPRGAAGARMEVCVPRRDVPVPEPLRPAQTPRAALRCGKERRRRQRGGKRWRAPAVSGQEGSDPALAWSCLAPRDALLSLLLKLSLPLFSLPPQDPGFASQALINKKLNDYRKVRYGPRGGGRRDPPSALFASILK